MTEPVESVIYLRVSTKDQAERGGEAEGFSIPAQREACLRKAEQVESTVVAEFVDAGESARSANRPELQRMLTFLRERSTVRYVIVHKVDRLARNRVDDVEINVAIRQAGASLVSCAENIDETPSGALMHGIMSSIAEFYSRNLAAEVIKGTTRKVQGGGTATRAPLGYLNIRQMGDTGEVRTVVADPERATHIAWAFEAYATGDWSISNLARELEARGLTTRQTRQQNARPVPSNKLHEILRNRYYLGYVSYRGVEYEGKHPPLVAPQVFDRVGEILDSRRTTSERSYRRNHYLGGSLFCARCGCRLIYTQGRGRHGGLYGYWGCLGRHSYKNGCDLPYLAEEVVADKVAAAWRQEQMTEAEASQLRDLILLDLADAVSHHDAERGRLGRTIQAIERDRRRWADNAMDGAVPIDIAREKQQELARKLSRTRGQLDALTQIHADQEELIRAALGLVINGHVRYALAAEPTRRDFNQAMWTQLQMDLEEDDVVVKAAVRSGLFEAIRTAEIGRENARAESTASTILGRSKPQPEKRPLAMSYRVFSHVRGLRVPCLVELRVPGFTT